jgi:hypothetical protein
MLRRKERTKKSAIELAQRTVKKYPGRQVRIVQIIKEYSIIKFSEPMSLPDLEQLLKDLRMHMNSAIRDAKAIHAPTPPLIYSVGYKAFFYLK